MQLIRLFREKPSTMCALSIGFLLLMAFPFGAVAYLVRFDSIAAVLVNTRLCHGLEAALHLDKDGCGASANIILMLKDHRWWEVISFFWTLIFTALFLWFELPKQYQALNGFNPSRWSTWHARLSLIVSAIMVASYLIYMNGFWGLLDPGYKSSLTAKVILAVTFVSINIFIIGRAQSLEQEPGHSQTKRLELRNIKEDFRIYNSYIDMPALVALSVLLVWDFAFAAPNPGDLPEFISGASSVILITTGFLFGISVVRDAPEGHQATNQPPTQTPNTTPPQLQAAAAPPAPSPLPPSPPAT